MRTYEDILSDIPFARPLVGRSYETEMVLDGLKGSVVFGFNEDGWEHVSFSPFRGKMPTWKAMCELKDTFWGSEEEVHQIHPVKAHYVNIMDNCLHLWRPVGGWKGEGKYEKE